MQLENVLYFLIWAGLFFIMMRFGCGSHIMGHGHYHSSAPGDRRNEPNPGWVPSDQAVDPVCRMNIKTAGAKSAVYRCKFDLHQGSILRAAQCLLHRLEVHHVQYDSTEFLQREWN